MKETATREKRTIETMIAIYCRRHHTKDGGKRGKNLCPECVILRDYCHARVDRCPLGSEKRSCRKCTVHCYSPAMRERIRAVMRYVGPRMIFLHPKMAVRHLLSERR